MLDAQRQMPALAGRVGVTHGEAGRDLASDEADNPRHNTEDTGSVLLQAALTRENLQRAWKRVKANKGAAGVDGLDIDQTGQQLRTLWPLIREQLLQGMYRPKPVRRVTIPKPDGGERELGIPMVTDRLIQQALLQVLQPLLDPTFSEHSHGFRPGRRAHDAVLAAQAHVQSGRRIVVDVDLEKRGHCFVRYADDCNVYVHSQKAGERVMILLRRCYAKLRLKVNETKSAVANAIGRKFLGYGFWVNKDGIKRRVADKPLVTFKQKVRQLTRRSGGRSMAEVIDRLKPYLLGWKAYFGLAQTPGIWRKLDEWIRHRLRAIQLKHWKRSSTMYRELRALGATEAAAKRVAGNSRCWWRNSAGDINRVLTIAHFDRLGVPRLS